MRDAPDIVALVADLRATAKDAARGPSPMVDYQLRVAREQRFEKLCKPASILAVLDDFDALTKRAETAEKELAETRHALKNEVAGRDPCPFANPRFELANDIPCPICGDLGDGDEPSRCISGPQVRS